MKLIVQNITGQYLNPKPGEPHLTDEESCYEFILNNCGNVLSRVGFDLEIDQDRRVYTEAQLKAKKIKDFDMRMAAAAEALSLRELNALLDEEEAFNTKPPMVRGAEKGAAFGGWLVGPAAVA